MPVVFNKAVCLLSCLFLCTFYRGAAQLCPGSTGDPVLRQTFGTTRTPLPRTQSEFAYAPGCPLKGQYTLANLIFGCGEDRSWLMLAGDHTRDVNGNYMLVNPQSSDGGTDTAVVYTDTARGLCGGLNYVFSVWATNALRPISCDGNAIPASLTLQVSTPAGIVLGTLHTGDLPIEDDKRWKEYGINFRLPPGETSVTLTVLTTRKPGCGQGFALDDITLSACGPGVMATLNGSTAPLAVCADFPGDFVLQGSYEAGLANPTIQWQQSTDTGNTWQNLPAANALQYRPSRQPEGVRLYRMLVSETAHISRPACRFVSNVLSTSVHPVPPHYPPQNLRGCLNKDLLLPARSPFAHQNLWTGPNGFTSTSHNAVVPAVTLADTGLYRLQQDFGFGCFSLDSFYVQVYPSTTLTVPPEFDVCEGQSVRLTASGDGNFQWQPSTGLSSTTVAAPVASPRDSTLYSVMVTNAFGCKDSALVKVNVHRNPVASAGPDRTIVRGDSALLEGVVRGTGVQYQWSPDRFLTSNAILTPRVYPPADQRYTLTAISTVGCGTAQASAWVRVYNDLYIPDAFSPNGDGKNDFFSPVAADGYRFLRFEVFNRWGQRIFESKGSGRGWDGTFRGVPQPQDTYVYFLQLQSPAGRLLTRKGSVTLVR